MTAPTRIPADVDRPDRLIGPFTARQLAILAATGLVLYLVWMLTRQVISPPLYVGLAIPVTTAAAALVLTTRDGLAGDQLLVAAVRHRLRARRLVATPGSVAPAPRWLTTRVRGKKPLAAQPLSAPAVRLPRGVTASGSDGLGVVDLGGDGLAVIAAAGTINLALRTPEEQDSLVGQLGHWLHSLRQPVQILTRTTRLDLTGRINDLREAARDMSPELARTAHGHAEHLAQLAADGDLQQRQVLLVMREPLDHPTPVAGVGAWLPMGRRAERDEASVAVRRAAESRLRRRLTEATELLAPVGVTVTPLDDAQAAVVLTAACDPGNLVAANAEVAAPDAVITTTSGGEGFAGDDTDDEPAAAPQPRGWRTLLRRDPTPTGVGVFAPESVTVGSRDLVVGADHVATLAVRGYPREVFAGWLSPLLSHPGRVDVSMHVSPVDPVTAAARLRRQLARLEASRSHDLGHGRLADQHVEVAVEDAADLSARIARGEGRLFRVSIYLTVHADTAQQLAEEVAAVRALAASLLIDACPVTYRALQGWVSTLPVGLDLVRMARTLDTAALSSAFPFSSPQLPVVDPTTPQHPDGVLYGRDAAGGLLFWDRFGAGVDNHNAVVLGRSGAGKSYLVKTEILRSLHRGVENIVIDPEDEYRRLAEAVGGTVIHLGAQGIRINPFDVETHTHRDGRRTAPTDAVTRRKLFLHTVIRVLLGDQTPAQRAVLDTALSATYLAASVTDDPTTWTRPAPTMSVLRGQLLALGSAVGDDLAAALAPFTAGGAFGGLLDGPSTASLDGGLIVFSLRELPDELKTIGTLLALDATWRRVSNPSTRRPRLVTVDEAWLLMRQPAGAEFLFRAAKSFRKHWAGLTVSTQDCADVLGTDLGKAIIANAPTQILLRQAPQAIDEVGAAFKLSAGERQFLLSAACGHGLLAVGPHRAVFASLASRLEHDAVTTDPSELAENAADDLGVDLDTEWYAPTTDSGDDPDDEDFIDLGDAA